MLIVSPHLPVPGSGEAETPGVCTRLNRVAAGHTSRQGTRDDGGATAP